MLRVWGEEEMEGGRVCVYDLAAENNSCLER